jgi:hypothetical protein
LSRLGEEIVEEWLNRQGYFTIRGIKLGVDEIDILAIRPLPDGKIDRRHIEVQLSVRPISYICKLPKKVQRETGRAANTSKRSSKELKEGVQEWVDKKYRKHNKRRLLESLGQGEWTEELVVHNVKSKHELELIRRHGIRILRLTRILSDLRVAKSPIKAASGSDLWELMHLAS